MDERYTVRKEWSDCRPGVLLTSDLGFSYERDT